MDCYHVMVFLFYRNLIFQKILNKKIIYILDIVIGNNLPEIGRKQY